VFETGFLCSFGAYPGTHSVDQAGLELRDSPASDSTVLELRACTTITVDHFSSLLNQSGALGK
ncbi:hypothetical protein ACQP3C_31120, partial [Escherichia coli]